MKASLRASFLWFGLDTQLILVLQIGRFFVVSGAGLEPARPKPRDFKSLVSTDSTTRTLDQLWIPRSKLQINQYVIASEAWQYFEDFYMSLICSSWRVLPRRNSSFLEKSPRNDRFGNF